MEVEDDIVEFTIMEDHTGSSDEEDEFEIESEPAVIDLSNCDYLMTSKLDVQEVTCNYPLPESPFEPKPVPGKLDFFWNGLNPETDKLLVNARKRPRNGNWMCGFCYCWTETKEELSEHMKSVHIPSARFHVCRSCNKKYVTEFLLERHQEAHKFQPTLPYEKYIDSNGVPTLGVVPNHFLEGVHPPKPLRGDIEEADAVLKKIANFKHKCLECAEDFDTSDKLNEHYKDFHAFISCKLCQNGKVTRIYKEFSILKNHLTLDHGLNYLQYYLEGYAKVWSFIEAEAHFRTIAASFVRFVHPYAAKPPPPPVPPPMPSPDSPPSLTNIAQLDDDLPSPNPGALSIDTMSTASTESAEKLDESVTNGTVITPIPSPRASNPTTVTATIKSTGKQYTKKLQPLIKVDQIIREMNGKSNSTEGTTKVEPQKTCYVCKKLVPYSTFEEHFASHTELKFKCTVEGCNKRFRTKPSLALHMRAHCKDRAFVCHLCPRGYNYSSLLKRHLRTHTGEMPYKCVTCGQRFYELVSLNYHKKKVHTLERPHKCTICGKGFILANDLRKHTLAHEKHALNVTTSSPPESPAEFGQTDGVDLDLDMEIREVGLDVKGEQFTISEG